MSELTIKTDNKFKPLRYRYEVPARVLANQFDHLDEDQLDGFFRYRRWWYHISDFMRLPVNPTFAAWDGYAGDSFFSGVVLRVSFDGSYKVGTYYS